MGKKETLLLITLVIIVLTPVFAQEESVTVGSADDWSGLAASRNVTTRTGYRGGKDLVLKDGEYDVTPTTDLLIHFNSASLSDMGGNYLLQGEGPAVTSVHARLGGGAAVYDDAHPPTVITAGPGAFFAPNSLHGSFSLEFWLYPVTMAEGETVFRWNGARASGSLLATQQFRIYVTDRRLSFLFHDFFMHPSGEPFDTSLTGRNRLIPRQWSHHLIRFDAESGLLEYTRDGVVEAVSYVTESGHEDGTVLLPYIGEGSQPRVTIGGGFTGLMDELRLSTRFVVDPFLYTTSNEPGQAVSTPVDLRYPGTRVSRIQAVYETPGDTDIAFFYRIANRKATPGSLDAPWIPFVPGRELDPRPKGRFLQLRADLLPDGSQEVSPRLSQITVTYLPDLPPAPPARVMAVGGDGSVTLHWAAVPENDIVGYRVYYGSKPGRYFGTDATQGASPVDVGKVNEITIDGLTNGRLYYFSVASYDASGISPRTVLSSEVSARPRGMSR